MSDPNAAIPVVRFPALYHVGTMNPSDKGRDGRSLEGHGLSVSTCPWAWEAICKLGGNPWWRLSGTGMRLLSVYELTPEQTSAVEAWAVQEGLLTAARRWRTEYHDDDGDLRYQLWDTPAQAAAEIEEEGTLSEVQVLAATDRLHARMGFHVADINAADLALVCWCENATDLDGLWWEDCMDEHALTAPRGVILPSALCAFSIEQVPRFDWWDAEDHEVAHEEAVPTMTI